MLRCFSPRPEALAAAVLIVSSCLLLSACGSPPPEPERTVFPVRILEVNESVIPTREFFGTAQASRSVDLSFRFGGQLIEFPIAQGDRIEQGQLIGSIDPREFQSRERQIASELDGARAVLTQMRRGARAEDVRRLESLVAARQAEAEDAAQQLERMERLFADQVISIQERDRFRVTAEVTRSAAESATLELEIARTGAREEELEAQEARIRGLESRLTEARDNLTDLTLIAPFAGIISRTFVSQFEDVRANQVVATLQDLTRIDVEIFLTESDVARIQGRIPEARSQTVAFAEFPALHGRRFPLILSEFQTQADPATQTFKVILRMEQDINFPVVPGMNAIVRGTGEGAVLNEFTIPVQAIWGAPDGTQSVWVVDPQTNRVSARAVQTGNIVGQDVVITEGLSVGERIVTTAVNRLREGLQVQQMRDLEGL